jgi:superfamily II DNA helicase RecQ
VVDLVNSIVTKERIKRESKRRAVNVKTLLRDNFSLETAFRGRQKEVVQATIDRESLLAYFAGTRSGKSISIFLPALLG